MDLHYLLIGLGIAAVLVVLARVWGQLRDTRVRSRPRTTAANDGAEGNARGRMADDSARALLEQARKFAAIRLLQERQGLSLIAAKKRVEAMGIEPDAAPAETDILALLEFTRTFAPEVTRLVETGQKAAAIRLISEHTGLSLDEARDVVDRFA